MGGVGRGEVGEGGEICGGETQKELNGLTTSISKMRLNSDIDCKYAEVRRSNSQNLKVLRYNDPANTLSLFKYNEEKSISVITRIDNTSDFGPLFESE